MRCMTCKSETTNPKFCSRSCAAQRNNHLYPKRGPYSRYRPTRYCLECKCVFKPKKGTVGKVCSQKCAHRYKFTVWKNDVLKKGVFPASQSAQRIRRFIREQLGHKCAICKRKTWTGQPIKLVLDHIDGNSNNWKVSNLRLICNNCDSLLPTYKGGNRGKGRHTRKLRYKQGKSY